MKQICYDAFATIEAEPEEGGNYLVWAEWYPGDGPAWKVASFSPRVDHDGTEYPHWWATEHDEDCKACDIWMSLPGAEE